MIAAVIFDCDGVLFDSWRANVAFYDEVLRAAGLPPLDDEWRRRAHVMASSQLFEAMFAHQPSVQERVNEASRATDYGPFYGLMEPMADLHATLERLSRDYRLALASNRGRTLAEVARRFDLERYLGAVVGARDVARPKPHPDMLLVCCERLSVQPRQALFVGDAPSDLEAARAAEMPFVALGEHDWAPRAIARLTDLPAFIEALPR